MRFQCIRTYFLGKKIESNFRIHTEKNIELTNFFCSLNKILVLLTKSFVKQKAITNSFVGSTNRFVGKTENLLGKQKNSVSSISTLVG